MAHWLRVLLAPPEIWIRFPVPTWYLQPSVAPNLGDLILSSGFCRQSMHEVHRHVCRQNAHAHENK